MAGSRLLRPLSTGLALVLFGAACASPPPPREHIEGLSTRTSTTTALEAGLAARADEISVQAARAEPATTALLSSLVADSSSWLHKLEHRLKTRSSLVRKLRLSHLERPSVPPTELWVGDALRYMMVTPDEPPGHHVAQARRILLALEAAGHRVREVKNYWPAGDNYSAINCDLETAGGFPWELQFQTPESLAANLKTRPLYEELRAPRTSKARKRALFDEMTEAWRTVPIPAGVLEPSAIHPKEEIRDRDRP